MTLCVFLQHHHSSDVLSASTFYTLEKNLGAFLRNRLRDASEIRKRRGGDPGRLRQEPRHKPDISQPCLLGGCSGHSPTASGGFLNPRSGRRSRCSARPTSLILMATSAHTRGRSQATCQRSLSTQLQGRFEPGLRDPGARASLAQAEPSVRATCHGVRGVSDWSLLSPSALSDFSSWVCVCVPCGWLGGLPL